MAVRTRAPKLRRQWIARPNALAALGNTLDFALVLIAAPAGYGKTALASQYAASQPSACAWLTLTEAERDPTVMAAMLDIVAAAEVIITHGGFSPIPASRRRTRRTLTRQSRISIPLINNLPGNYCLAINHIQDSRNTRAR